jgi:hypothetical protein
MGAVLFFIARRILRKAFLRAPRQWAREMGEKTV